MNNNNIDSFYIVDIQEHILYVDVVLKFISKTDLKRLYYIKLNKFFIKIST
jgi:hypothetical protein